MPLEWVVAVSEPDEVDDADRLYDPNDANITFVASRNETCRSSSGGRTIQLLIRCLQSTDSGIRDGRDKQPKTVADNPSGAMRHYR